MTVKQHQGIVNQKTGTESTPHKEMFRTQKNNYVKKSTEGSTYTLHKPIKFNEEDHSQNTMLINTEGSNSITPIYPI